MRNLLDLHTHTLFSGHAYSTLLENMNVAADKGLLFYGVSDHAPGLPCSTNEWNFKNYKVIPEEYRGVHFLSGVELDIVNEDGDIDLNEHEIEKLDYLIASIHIQVFDSKDTDKNTEAYINCMNRHHLNILGHPDDGRAPFHVEPVIACAKKNHVLVEINNSSLGPKPPRLDSRKWLKEVVKYCKEYDVPVIIDSDAHFCLAVGSYEDALKFLQEEGFPMDRIANFNIDLIHEYFPKTKDINL